MRAIELQVLVTVSNLLANLGKVSPPITYKKPFIEHVANCLPKSLGGDTNSHELAFDLY